MMHSNRKWGVRVRADLKPTPYRGPRRATVMTFDALGIAISLPGPLAREQPLTTLLQSSRKALLSAGV